MGSKPKRKPIYKIENRDRVLTYIGVSTMFFDEILKKLETLSDKSSYFINILQKPNLTIIYIGKTWDIGQLKN